MLIQHAQQLERSAPGEAIVQEAIALDAVSMRRTRQPDIGAAARRRGLRLGSCSTSCFHGRLTWHTGSHPTTPPPFGGQARQLLGALGQTIAKGLYFYGYPSSLPVSQRLNPKYRHSARSDTPRLDTASSAYLLPAGVLIFSLNAFAFSITGICSARIFFSFVF